MTELGNSIELERATQPSSKAREEKLAVKEPDTTRTQISTKPGSFLRGSTWLKTIYDLLGSSKARRISSTQKARANFSNYLVQPRARIKMPKTSQSMNILSPLYLYYSTSDLYYKPHRDELQLQCHILIWSCTCKVKIALLNSKLPTQQQRGLLYSSVTTILEKLLRPAILLISVSFRTL